MEAAAVVERLWPGRPATVADLSGGITAPASIRYHHGTSTPVAGGPIVDTHGHPIDALRTMEEPGEG